MWGAGGISYTSFYSNFCLTSHKAPRSSGLKGANIYFKDKPSPENQEEILRPGHKLPHV